MKILTRAWEWLMYSAQDANKLSLFIKGVAAFIPAIVVMFASLHVKVTADELTQLIDAIVLAISAVATAISTIAGVWGLIRKIFYTAKGENDVVATWKVEDRIEEENKYL